MRKLYLYSNWFEGSIPISLSNVSRLERLGLENNYFTGVVPWELGAVRSMSWLALGNNSLEAKESGDWGFVDFLTNCSNLQVFDISHNMFGGMLPISIGNLSTQLQWLSMEGNKITGTIPAEIGRYVNLTFLSMFDNLLMGSIPTTIGKLESLNQLRLFGKGFSGEISSSLGNLTQLVELNLGGNFLEGSIPSSVGRLASLNLLNLSCNMLVGSIPKEIVSLSSLTRYLDISRNSLTGPLPGELGSLKNLVGLNVSENKLSGEIPSSIGECQVLGYLLMEGNYLQGAIPSTLRNLRGIQDLDLSRNNLSGEFPDFLESFKYLQYLNLSFNDLEGQVPTGGIFQNLSSFSLIGNTQLCGGDKELHLQECPTETSKQRHSSPSVKVIASVVGGVAGFFLLFSFIAFVYWVKFPRTDSLIRSSSIDEHSRVSYVQLVKATDAFSSANLIGAGSFGSVYKGILSSDEKVIAVKVFNLQQRGGSRSFMAECEALRNTRHRNLVKILSSCSSTDSDGNEFKALIYEFMPNGSLEEWLHPESSSMNLDFIQRWNIAIDVASALDYLHHYGHTPIVHCDLKPNNILLDEDMVTRISDFGLARFIHTAAQGISEIPFSSRGLKGSIGYIAPEYGIHGQISTHGDAYSYGILLLEMFTGKRPTDDAFKDGLSLRKSVEMAFPERVMDIIDPRLILDNNNHNKSTNNAAGKLHKYMLLVIGVVLSCSEDSPRERREMGQVVKEMLAARDMFLGEFISKQDFIKE